MCKPDAISTGPCCFTTIHPSMRFHDIASFANSCTDRHNPTPSHSALPASNLETDQGPTVSRGRPRLFFLGFRAFIYKKGGGGYLLTIEAVGAGMETATSAAAVGGITTVVDMPLNSDPTTTTVELLQKKISATKVSQHHCSRAEQTQAACSSEGSTAVLKTFIMCSPLDRKALGDLQVGERSVAIAYNGIPGSAYRALCYFPVDNICFTFSVS